MKKILIILVSLFAVMGCNKEMEMFEFVGNTYLGPRSSSQSGRFVEYYEYFFATESTVHRTLKIYNKETEEWGPYTTVNILSYEYFIYPNVITIENDEAQFIDIETMIMNNVEYKLVKPDKK